MLLRDIARDAEQEERLQGLAQDYMWILDLIWPMLDESGQCGNMTTEIFADDWCRELKARKLSRPSLVRDTRNLILLAGEARRLSVSRESIIATVETKPDGTRGVRIGVYPVRS